MTNDDEKPMILINDNWKLIIMIMMTNDDD